MYTDQIESSDFNARERHYAASAQPKPHCCVCRETARGNREVTPCSNVDCDRHICSECRPEDTIEADLGSCDDPRCARIALRDLRSVYTSAVRTAERRAA